ncbi:DUF4843 domain-containing protein [Ochrovirga pacifica]|uniref:DUF4843 domain-containing protein n=1 Tax=Ochrovirga pacifica TaxID=1042376 RepID=UPI0002559FD4|nr:DUF4843 domain-containing protein [Ochrovirga pacifica]
MKTIKSIIKYVTMGMLCIVTLACAKDEIEAFKGADGVTFLPQSETKQYQSTYSFLGNETGEYLQEVQVQVIGQAAEIDRYFRVVPVLGDETTADESLYEIVEGVVKANEYSGVLKVKLRNATTLANQTVSLQLQLEDSDDFSAGVVETNKFTLSWTDQIVVPAWTYIRFFFTPVASTAAYRVFVTSTGLMEFGRTEYIQVGSAGAVALGTKFGDYIKQWNLDHPDNPLLHDDGSLAGQPIVPRYYTKSKYD